jgi:hypothetical protein
MYRHLPKIDEANDKLKAAFKATRGRGFLARMNFSCCGSCGHYELSERRERTDAKGYIFFHNQTNEKRLDGYDFYCYFDNVESAEVFIEELENAGLDSDWDGMESSAVLIKWEDACGVEV